MYKEINIRLQRYHYFHRMTEFEDLMSEITHLYEISRITNKEFWTFDELFNKRFSNEQSDETLKKTRLKDVLDKLKHKGAVNFNEFYSNIILDSVKLCLLTTDQNINADDLIKRSSDLEEDCYKKKLWNKCKDLMSLKKILVLYSAN